MPATFKEPEPYHVIELKGWSYIEEPGGTLDGPWRYRWEAEEEAERRSSKSASKTA